MNGRFIGKKRAVLVLIRFTSAAKIANFREKGTTIVFFFLLLQTSMKQLITILGPTASGKTPLAAALACETGGEIISADSRQVYRRMDLGTGKDLADYRVVVDGSPVDIPYHLIDICEPGTKC